ncbi:thioredoxin-like protein [Xylariales sp. PMI_506]|nr:thioredoxin-like protein [Xylariales sp. PMI_506]
MKFDIKIISDSVCPWCYVGKRRLEAGIAAYRAAHAGRGDTFSVSWHPFYLQPDAPAVGVDKRTRYRERFGDAKAEAIFERLAGVGDEVGIKFSFGGKTGHTRDSHRLIRSSSESGDGDANEVQSRVVDELFRRYFELEQDITSRAMLREAAEAAGLDGDEVQAYLETDQGLAEVDEEVERAQALGVHGVPNIRINGMFEMPGAVEPDMFRQVFEKVAAYYGESS